MDRHLLLVSGSFLAALVLGGAVAAVLSAVGLGEPWSMAAGWAVFIGFAAAMGRRLHHRPPVA